MDSEISDDVPTHASMGSKEMHGDIPAKSRCDFRPGLAFCYRLPDWPAPLNGRASDRLTPRRDQILLLHVPKSAHSLNRALIHLSGHRAPPNAGPMAPTATTVRPLAAAALAMATDSSAAAVQAASEIAAVIRSSQSPKLPG